MLTPDGGVLIVFATGLGITLLLAFRMGQKWERLQRKRRRQLRREQLAHDEMMRDLADDARRRDPE